MSIKYIISFSRKYIYSVCFLNNFYLLCFVFIVSTRVYARMNGFKNAQSRGCRHILYMLLHIYLLYTYKLHTYICYLYKQYGCYPYRENNEIEWLVCVCVCVCAEQFPSHFHTVACARTASAQLQFY